MNSKKRADNERKFEDWVDTETGDRVYRMKINGKFGWHAIYEKIVDKDENTLKFTQFIYDEKSALKEIHEKYPLDKGHQKL